MFTTVTLRSPPEQRVVLPSSALLMNNDRTSVFVATAPWTFERRTVEPLLEESSMVAIAAGVKPANRSSCGAEFSSMIDQFVDFCLRRRVAVILLAVLLARVWRLCLGNLECRGLSRSSETWPRR